MEVFGHFVFPRFLGFFLVNSFIYRLFRAFLFTILFRHFVICPINYLKKEGDFVKPLKIDEVKYGKQLRKAYRNFLEDITPNAFEVIDDMSKLILINQNGQVEMITSYKDLDKGKWVKGQKDEGTINKILPLIQ